LSVEVGRYDKPTEALYGSVRLEKLVDELKRVAREYFRKKMTEGLMRFLPL